MSEILEDYQQEEAIKEEETANYSFAVVGEVYEDGVSLIFPGAEEPSEKHYKTNLYCKFKAGQRVYIAKDSGTYIALFPVGKPDSVPVEADSATTAKTATSATQSEKLSNSRTIQLTGGVTGSVDFDGSQDVNLNTTVQKATTADRWTNSRTLTISGDGSGSVSFNGSSNFTLKITIDNFQERHMGSRLSFFGGGLASKRSVSQLSGTVDLDDVKSKLNDLIYTLHYYNLV